MTNPTPRFESQQDIKDVTKLLMGLCNIAPGRNIVWLLNDGVAADNFEAIERWLRAEVWKRQRNSGSIDLNSLSQSLTDRLGEALLNSQP